MGNQQITFPEWLVQSILRGCLRLQETRFTFGKHNGKDHTDRSIPAPYIRWALENINNNRLISPEFRRELEQELENRARGNRGSARQPAARAAAAPAAPATPARRWFFAKVIRDGGEMKTGQYVALAKRDDGRSDFVTLSGPEQTGIFSREEVARLIQAIKDNEEYVTATNPMDLKSKVPDYQGSNAPQKSQMIPEEMISDEQRKIDERFEKLMGSPHQSHMMINALAGTGKTTLLKHLAWKYGKPGQRWLYLVFNTKNKVEAEEAFPREVVQVRTTNGFLGEVLKDRANVSRITQTDRLIGLANKGRSSEDTGGKLEKSRILADGPGFVRVMKSLGIPDKLVCPDCKGDLTKKKQGRSTLAWCNRCHEAAYDTTGNTIMSLIRSISYEFKEAVLTLVGLAKSYALDPRKPEALKKGLKDILDDYDTVDTEMSDIKERINKYSGYFKTEVVQHLNDVLGYNFMAKTFGEEIKEAATWMLNETLPGKTTEKYKRGNVDYNLGDFRDFNDDIWFAAAHADELVWPKYDVVLADEVQDFNEAQKIMLKKLGEAGAKIVAVGDPNQSIYRFRGADADAFDNLAKSLTDWSHEKENVVHTISKNFRSRPAILEFSNANTHVKNLQTGKKWKEGDQGEVTEGEVKYDDAFNQLRTEKTDGKIKQTAFIARTNEPLVHAALKLLAQGVPFVVLGKDIVGDLIKHIRKITTRFGLTDEHSCNELEERMNGFLEQETDAYETHATKRAYLQDLKEATEAILACMGQFDKENNQGGSIKQFKGWLSERLGSRALEVQDNEADFKEYRKKMEEENPIVLTTAHKSKGLEFSRVYILRHDLFPHKKAKKPKDLVQEANAKYVAYTRAKDELHILDLEGQPGYKPPRGSDL